MCRTCSSTGILVPNPVRSNGPYGSGIGFELYGRHVHVSLLRISSLQQLLPNIVKGCLNPFAKQLFDKFLD